MFFKKKKTTELNKEMLPQHIAFIMDGNGRWAKKRGMPRVFGHNAGTEAFKEIVRESRTLGIRYVSFYAFSTENWKRPQSEVDGLMQILVKFIASESEEIHANNIKINILGDIAALPKEAKKAVEDVLLLTENNTAMDLNIALNYGGRYEIVSATQRLVKDIDEGKVTREAIDETLFSSYLYTKDMPDPDLMIRTSGEYRLSNFLLWQLAYSEFIFLDIFWPDFSIQEYHKALQEYASRNRRFGKI